MNKYRPHVMVIPEDDANRQIANGFLLEPVIHARSIQVLPPSGGWIPARDRLVALLREMASYPLRVMVLLVDFDRDPERGADILAHVPEDLRERVFVLGAHGEPEALRTDLGKFEQIGRALAQECADGQTNVWAHPLLAHNAGEAARLLARVRPFLFT